MSQWLRMGYGLAGTVALAMAAIVWLRVGDAHLVELATETHAGPFSYIVEWMEVIVPGVIAILLLALWAWVFAGPVQRERTQFPLRRV